MAKRTITLTGRPPVSIDDDKWDVIAKAQDYEHDGQVECQANRKSQWSIRVRKHEDGRAIVNAIYTYTSNWQGARCYTAKHGKLLPTGCTNDDICRAIEEVACNMAESECDGNDADRWPTLAAECIADMPAEELN